MEDKKTFPADQSLSLPLPLSSPTLLTLWQKYESYFWLQVQGKTGQFLLPL